MLICCFCLQLTDKPERSYTADKDAFEAPGDEDDETEDEDDGKIELMYCAL